MARRLLIRGAFVISMDRDVGDVLPGDILVATPTAPLVEMQMGHGLPPTGRLLEAGIRPSMSIDVTTTVPGEMFTQMRIMHATDRMLEHERAFAEQRDAASRSS